MYSLSKTQYRGGKLGLQKIKQANIEDELFYGITGSFFQQITVMKKGSLIY